MRATIFASLAPNDTGVFTKPFQADRAFLRIEETLLNPEPEPRTLSPKPQNPILVIKAPILLNPYSSPYSSPLKEPYLLLRLLYPSTRNPNPCQKKPKTPLETKG